jgi:hypothetical protein
MLYTISLSTNVIDSLFIMPNACLLTLLRRTLVAFRERGGGHMIRYRQGKVPGTSTNEWVQDYNHIIKEPENFQQRSTHANR